jgi:putative DNA primase/helicase
VDLDHVIDAEGTLTPEAREVMGWLNSYTEVSPSGTGLHIFVTASGADISRHRKQDGFVEIYGEARYFTVTGNVYGGVKPIAERAAELRTVHDKFLLSDADRKTNQFVSIPSVPDVEQERFLRMGLGRDKVLAALWAGERRCGNESADDQALMNKLAYWCNADPSAMIRAFFSSPYYTGKDEYHKKKCQRVDYLPDTAKNACVTAYSTARADYERWRQGRHRRNRQRERSCAR